MAPRVFLYIRRSEKKKSSTSISMDEQKNSLIKECKKE
jgi:hypothetical protein